MMLSMLRTNLQVFVSQVQKDTTKGVKKLEHIEEDMKKLLSSSNRKDNKFEYSFFCLVKLTLTKLRCQSEVEQAYPAFHQLLIFCLNRCSSQYKLFKLSENGAQFDADDELNVIELMEEFTSSLLSVMHRCKEFYNETFAGLDLDNSIPVSFHDLLASLLSIYIDTMLELKHKLSRYRKMSVEANARQLGKRLRHLAQTICFNTFFLLDSKPMTTCNLIIQLSNLNARNLKHVLPMIEKTFKNIHDELRIGKKNEQPIKRRIYFRMILIYAKLRHILEKTDNQADLIDCLKKQIYEIEAPTELQKFARKLVKNHLKDEMADADLSYMTAKINKFESSGKKLRKYLLTKINERQVLFLIKALHNKRLAFSGEVHDMFEIKPESAEFISHSALSGDTEGNKETVDGGEPCDELEFTSDYSIFSSCDEEDMEFEDGSIQMKAVANCCDPKLNTQPTVVLSPLDLSKIGKVNSDEGVRSSSSYSSEIDSSNTNGDELTTNTNRNDTQTAPTLRMNPKRTNLSRLNLFRNFFGNDHDMNEFNRTTRASSMNSKTIDEFSIKKELFNTNANRMCTRSTSTAAAHTSKFYKLNDLVSIMINEDYFSQSEITMCK